MPPRKKPTPPPERWTVDITTRDLADFLAPVIPHAAKSNDLPILNGVHFATRGGYLIAAATDRYTMAMHRRKSAGPDEIPVPDGLRGTVPLAAVQQILSVFKAGRGENPGLTLTFTRDLLAVGARGFLSGFAVSEATWRLDPGEYPRLDHIWPTAKPESSESAVFLKPAFLARLAHAPGAGDPVQLTLMPRKSDGQPGMVMARAGEDFLAVIQPVRLSGERAGAGWPDDAWRDFFAATAETKEETA
jgi:hypothetical protein